MRKISIGRILCATLLFLMLAISLMPMYLMFATSTMSATEFTTNFWGIAWPPKWENYVVAWNGIKHYVLNTLICSSMTVLFSTTLAVLSGYAFAKMRFKGKDALYMTFMAFRMLPATLLLIPNFLMAYRLGLYNTHLGVVLPGLAAVSFMPMILVMNYFRTIPDSIFEAARIDGANEWGIIKNVLLPLGKPIILTCMLFTFFGTIGTYTWPLLILRDDSLKTVAIGLTAFSGQYGTDYGVQMAAYSIVSAALMILVGLTMKTYINGITAGAVKG